MAAGGQQPRQAVWRPRWPRSSSPTPLGRPQVMLPCPLSRYGLHVIDSRVVGTHEEDAALCHAGLPISGKICRQKLTHQYFISVILKPVKAQNNRRMCVESARQKARPQGTRRQRPPAAGQQPRVSRARVLSDQGTGENQCDVGAQLRSGYARARTPTVSRRATGRPTESASPLRNRQRPPPRSAAHGSARGDRSTCRWRPREASEPAQTRLLACWS